MAQRNSSFDIRSFPVLGPGGRKYPVSFNIGQEFKVFSVPIGNQQCSSDCYIDTQMPEFDTGNTTNCRVCRKELTKGSFIDIGLMALIYSKRSQIQTNKYTWVNLDSESRVINWESKSNPLIQALSKYVGNQSMVRQDPGCINYHKMKSEMRNRFGPLFSKLNQQNSSRVITWCRANLKTDETFNGVLVNLSTNSNKFNFFGFVDQLGTNLTFQGKYSHINYIPRQNIFIIIRSHSGNKSMNVYVCDLTQGVIDSNKLRVFEVPLALPYMCWFSTMYNCKTENLYLVGGEYSNRENKGGITRLRNIEWENNSLTVDVISQFQFKVSNLMNAVCAFRRNKRDLMMIAGGVVARDRAIKYDIVNNLYSYDYEGGDHKTSVSLKQRGQCAQFDAKIGAYSVMVEVPQIGKDDDKNKSPGGVLVFSGNTDYRTDMDRHKFSAVYLWAHLQNIVEIKSTRGTNATSNASYPFLFQNTGSLVRDSKGQYFIRALIPARNSSYKEIKAYLLEYNVKTKSCAEYPISTLQIIT